MENLKKLEKDELLEISGGGFFQKFKEWFLNLINSNLEPLE